MNALFDDCPQDLNIFGGNSEGVMIAGLVGMALAAHMTVGSPLWMPNVSMLEQVQYRVPVHPPPCGNGWDISARDGMCYPNGYLPPQEQAARQGYYGRPAYYGRGRYPVPCGDGADVDIRDGRCYPNGMVPPRYQDRPHYRY